VFSANEDAASVASL